MVLNKKSICKIVALALLVFFFACRDFSSIVSNEAFLFNLRLFDRENKIVYNVEVLEEFNQGTVEVINRTILDSLNINGYEVSFGAKLLNQEIGQSITYNLNTPSVNDEIASFDMIITSQSNVDNVYKIYIFLLEEG